VLREIPSRNIAVIIIVDFFMVVTPVLT
jgi:hypothetical protein